MSNKNALITFGMASLLLVGFACSKKEDKKDQVAAPAAAKAPDANQALPPSVTAGIDSSTPSGQTLLAVRAESAVTFDQAKKYLMDLTDYEGITLLEEAVAISGALSLVQAQADLNDFTSAYKFVSELENEKGGHLYTSEMCYTLAMDLVTNNVYIHQDLKSNYDYLSKISPRATGIATNLLNPRLLTREKALEAATFMMGIAKSASQLQSVHQRLLEQKEADGQFALTDSEALEMALKVIENTDLETLDVTIKVERQALASATTRQILAKVIDDRQVEMGLEVENADLTAASFVPVEGESAAAIAESQKLIPGTIINTMEEPTNLATANLPTRISDAHNSAVSVYGLDVSGQKELARIKVEEAAKQKAKADAAKAQLALAKNQRRLEAIKAAKQEARDKKNKADENKDRLDRAADKKK